MTELRSFTQVQPGQVQLDAQGLQAAKDLLPFDVRSALRRGAEHLEEEFGAVCDRDTIDAYVLASYRSLLGVARIPNFVPLLTHRFARQRLRALVRLEDRQRHGLPTVLFLDEHNAGRSQMAMAFLNHDGRGRLDGWSGGLAPVDRLDETVVAAMHEVGLPMSDEYPKPWTCEVLRAADLVVCTGIEPPAELDVDVAVQTWPVPDPIGLDLPAIRDIRDDLRSRVGQLITAHAA